MRRTVQRRAIGGALIVMGALLLGLAAVSGTSRPVNALTNCSVADFSLDGEEQAFLTLLNGYRQQYGLQTLTISANLNRDAAWMVNDLATNNRFDHTDSLGRSAYQRAIDCGYPQGAGENLAAGTAWSTAQAAFDAWKASPGHNANMLGSYYLQVGIARLYSPTATYGWYWATEFGAVDDGGGVAPPPAAVPTATPTRTPSPAPTSTPSAPTSTPPPAATAYPTQPPGSGGTSTPAPTTVPRTASPTATTTRAAASPTATSTPAAAHTAPAGPGTAKTPSSLPLARGANLVAWPSADAHPADALAGRADEISIVYQYDATTGRWLRYGPSLPEFLNNITMMHRGAPYWVIAKNTTDVPIR